MRRRRFIASAVTVAAGFNAGCVGEGGESPSEPDPGDEPAGTDTPTASPTRSDRDAGPRVRGHSIETVKTDCMSGDIEGIEASFGEATVDIDGVASTPTPCYEAAVESAAVTDSELRVQVGFARDDSDACVECIGAVTYGATIDLDTTDGIDTVVVTHGDEEFTETRGGASPSPSPGDGRETTRLDDPGSDPDPDLQVSLDNEHRESHEIRLEIQRESGETVYAETHEIGAGNERDVYNLREASPDGVETFTITATMGGNTESIRVETSTCYGAAIVSVTDDGALYPYYAIC